MRLLRSSQAFLASGSNQTLSIMPYFFVRGPPHLPVPSLEYLCQVRIVNPGTTFPEFSYKKLCVLTAKFAFCMIRFELGTPIGCSQFF